MISCYICRIDPEDVLAAENAEELLEFYLLDMSVRGEYPPYVAYYLKQHDFYPKTRPGDEEDLKGSKPDFIGINYYFSITAKKKEGQINYDQPPFWISDAFDECENPYLEVTEWHTVKNRMKKESSTIHTGLTI